MTVDKDLIDVELKETDVRERESAIPAYLRATAVVYQSYTAHTSEL